MKTTTRIAMCLLLMGLFTATTGCDDVLPSGFGEALGSLMDSDIFNTDIEDDGGWGDDDGGWGNDDGGWGSTDGTYQGDSSSGTFFSDHGGWVSWS